MNITYDELRAIKHNLPTGSVARIAEELEVTPRTIYRDIRDMLTPDENRDEIAREFPNPKIPRRNGCRGVSASSRSFSADAVRATAAS